MLSRQVRVGVHARWLALLVWCTMSGPSPAAIRDAHRAVDRAPAAASPRSWRVFDLNEAPPHSCISILSPYQPVHSAVMVSRCFVYFSLAYSLRNISKLTLFPVSGAKESGLNSIKTRLSTPQHIRYDNVQAIVSNQRLGAQKEKAGDPLWTFFCPEYCTVAVPRHTGAESHSKLS